METRNETLPRTGGRTPPRAAGSKRILICGLTLVLIAGGSTSHADTPAPLTMDEAVTAAEQRDPTVSRYQAMASAEREAAISAASLPDPQLSAGVMGLPADSFALNESDMTQLVLGVRQAFPSGRAEAGEQRNERARVKHAQARNAEREVRRQTRGAFLGRYLREQELDILDTYRPHFEELLESAERAVAVGQASRQERLQAELALERLDDRIQDAHTEMETAQAELVRLVGQEVARRPLADAMPALELPNARNQIGVGNHPRLEVEAARIGVGQAREREARAAYRPDWSLEVSYGARRGQGMDGSTAPDLLSAMVMVELPLFAGNRQDRDLAASRYQVNAAQDMLRDTRYELEESLAKVDARQERLSQRIDRYVDVIQELASENAEAALSGYSSRTVEFVALHQARITELDARLDVLRLQVQEREARADLLYLLGDPE